MLRAPSVLPALILLVSLGACGGSDAPTGPGGDVGGDSPSAPTVKEDPSFSSDIVPMFTRLGCTQGGCHGSTASAGLNLASSPYANLVGVASTQTGEPRVIPGNANDSYLVKKLEGRTNQGVRMPPGGQIGATDLANLKNWINQGAKNN